MSPAILSQSEIDALLASLPSEEQPSAAAEPQPQVQTVRNVKAYDFRHPNKFSREQLRTLEMLHDGFARRLSTSLSSFLRTIVAASLVSVEQENYDEFVQRVPIPTVLYVCSLDPLPGMFILELHVNVAFIIVDRLLGGFGRTLAKVRELSEVEQSLLSSVMAEIMAVLREAWNSILPVTPKVQQVASTPQFLQVASGRDVVLTLTFEVKVIDSTSRMRLCLPYVVLEPIVQQLTAQARFANSRRDMDETQASHLRRNIDRVKVPVIAQLGAANVSIEQLLHLRQGDFIRLDALTNDDIPILVNGEHRFGGRPGLAGKRLAVQVTRVMEEGDDGAE